MFTAGAADWVIVGAAVVVDVVAAGGCCVAWQPHSTAARARMPVSVRAPIKGALAGIRECVSVASIVEHFSPR